MENISHLRKKDACIAAFALNEYVNGREEFPDEETADYLMRLAIALGMWVAPHEAHSEIVIHTGCQYGPNDEIIPYERNT